MDNQQPLVSIVTPVYNGEQYIRECIESVLQQNYHNWEYIILDNCSSDHTPQIIQEYANADQRIKIHTNDELLPIMQNWNAALLKISPAADYCKIVHADDLLYASCINSMVEVGEKHPSVGIIGSYTLWGDSVACDGLSHKKQIFTGHEICRLTLKRKIYPFLSPSTLMVRANIIHERSEFYPGPNLEADVDILYEVLKQHDFGFVPQILSFIRTHAASATSTLTKPLNTLLPQKLKLLVKYGNFYLDEDEYKTEINRQLRKYYRFLAKAAYRKRDDQFWEFHKQELQELGHPLSKSRLRRYLFLHWVNQLKKRLELKLTRKFT